MALGKVGFCKALRDSIEKIKADPKFQGDWKRIFIQYKSRHEKRKSWKEKIKLLKSIESNLEIKEPIDDSDKTLEDVESSESDIYSSQTELEKNSKINNIKNQSSLREKFKESSKELAEKIKNDESDNDRSEEALVNRRAKSDLNDEISFKCSSDSNESKAPDKKKNVSCVNTTNKPGQMEIKQIDLDAVIGLGEIPIETKQVDESQNEDEIYERIKLAKKKEKTDEKQTLKVNKTIKVKDDPFFLDEQGNEIVNESVEMENKSYENRANQFEYADYDHIFKNQKMILSNRPWERQKQQNSTRYGFQSNLNRKDFHDKGSLKV
jgi:hypothetical protein